MSVIMLIGMLFAFAVIVGIVKNFVGGIIPAIVMVIVAFSVFPMGPNVIAAGIAVAFFMGGSVDPHESPNIMQLKYGKLFDAVGTICVIVGIILWLTS